MDRIRNKKLIQALLSDKSDDSDDDDDNDV
jgi:hypothetical protein